MYDVSILETILRRRMYLNGSNTCCLCLCTFSMLSTSNMYVNRAHEHVYENWTTKKFINRYALSISSSNITADELLRKALDTSNQ